MTNTSSSDRSFLAAHCARRSGTEPQNEDRPRTVSVQMTVTLTVPVFAWRDTFGLEKVEEVHTDFLAYAEENVAAALRHSLGSIAEHDGSIEVEDIRRA